MRKYLLGLLVLVMFFSTSCKIKGGVGANVTYSNDEVDKKILESVKALDDKVLEGINNNDADKIIEIGSKAIKDDPDKLKDMLKKINEITKNKSYDYQGRYYSKISRIGDYDFTIKTAKDDPFSIDVKSYSKEMFVSLLKSNSQKDDYMVSLIYIKDKGDWKLNTIYFGPYRYDGMDAINYYEKAKALDDKGFTIPAALNMSIANTALHPAPFVRYKREQEVNDFTKKLEDKINKNFDFPKKLSSGNNAEIYGIDLRYLKDGAMPIITYITKTELSNENAIKNEANEINKEVCTLYPGLKDSFKQFLYEAYSETPSDPKKTYKYYRTIVNQN